MGWIFQGNPKQFHVDDYLSQHSEFIYWHTPRYRKEISIGDRAFIWRSTKLAGAVAIGSVVELPTLESSVKHPDALREDLWIINDSESKEPKEEFQTGIHLDEVRLLPDEGMVSRTTVKSNEALSQTQLIRMGAASVFKFSKDQTEILERLWGHVYSEVNRLDLREGGANRLEIEEGERKLRSHFRRERSSRLRTEKLRSFRDKYGYLSCELCGHKESSVYPEVFAERIFEVHHRLPISLAITPVRTTLDDLAILCANCHRAVHSTKSVEENFELLKKHFSK